LCPVVIAPQLPWITIYPDGFAAYLVERLATPAHCVAVGSLVAVQHGWFIVPGHWRFPGPCPVIAPVVIAGLRCCIAGSSWLRGWVRHPVLAAVDVWLPSYCGWLRRPRDNLLTLFAFTRLYGVTVGWIAVWFHVVTTLVWTPQVEHIAPRDLVRCTLTCYIALIYVGCVAVSG